MGFAEDLKQQVNNYIDSAALGQLESKVNQVLRNREELKSWSDKELRTATLAFKDDIAKGAKLDRLLVQAFSVANEAARRIFNKSPYPVQILAGMVIHQGKVAEMKAGEGKTLMETMPVYLNALEGKGVHIVTTNDYLAERDAKEMGKLYNFLGLSVGFISSQMKNDQRRKSYASDITYVTNQEIGFDYLRDNLVYTRADRVLRPEHALHYGIVDEIDSILIDESRTPLIIAQPVKEKVETYNYFMDIVNRMEEGVDYVVDYPHKTVSMTDEGIANVESVLGGPVFGEKNPMYVFYLDVCLKAKTIFERDRDYIVTEGGVEIVDEFTGRVLPGRRFTDGVHQAIEAKEGVKVKESDKTQAAITFQNFFPMYEKLSGMSGTVMGAREEFNNVYKLDVVQIPTNKPTVRNDMHDLFFKTEKGKFLGLLKKVEYIHKRGQPILIGARNVEVAHRVAKLLEGQNFPYQLLTAANHAAEEQKIAHAGEPGMITVATNMAGRGTDILLGTGVERMGGLYVLGTERHESRRIDDQLRGRAGRNGDPGVSQFFISMEDEIFSLFGSEEIIDAMEELDLPEDEYIAGKTLDAAFKKAQDFVESKNYDSRIYLYKYDSVTSFQRNFVYKLRDSLLENRQGFIDFVKLSVQDTIEDLFATGDAGLVQRNLKDWFSLEVPGDELKAVFQKNTQAVAWTIEEVKQKFTEFVTEKAMMIQEHPDAFDAAQALVLQVIDNNWSTHLELTDILKQESSLLSYASDDPLLDYIKESRRLFEHMQADVKQELIKSIFFYLGNQGLLK